MTLRSVSICVVLSAGLLVTLGGVGESEVDAGLVPARVPPPVALTLQHATLVVSDFDESMTFYEGILGLDRIDAPFLPERQVFLSLGPGLELHVGEVPGVEIQPNGFNHFAITPEDFDAFLEHLRASGVVYSNLGGGQDFYVQLRGDGVRQTFFQDPDGYWLEANDFPGTGTR